MGAKSSACPNAAVEPLAHDKSILANAISSLHADGWTAGHLGIAWSWYTLSPDWAPVWPFNRRTESAGSAPVRRYAVLMTDGDFNTHYENGQGNCGSQARQLCTAMKADGIEIYSVAFNAPSAGRAILEFCATSSAHFHAPTTGTELLAVYEAIAAEVRQVRISR